MVVDLRQVSFTPLDRAGNSVESRRLGIVKPEA